MPGKRVSRDARVGDGATKRQSALEMRVRQEEYERLVTGLNAEIVKAQQVVANEDVDAAMAEGEHPQVLVNGSGAVLTLLWVHARWNGMAETEQTVAALEEAQILLADLLLKAWVVGRQGQGGGSLCDVAESEEV